MKLPDSLQCNLSMNGTKERGKGGKGSHAQQQQQQQQQQHKQQQFLHHSLNMSHSNGARDKSVHVAPLTTPIATPLYLMISLPLLLLLVPHSNCLQENNNGVWPQSQPSSQQQFATLDTNHLNYDYNDYKDYSNNNLFVEASVLDSGGTHHVAEASSLVSSFQERTYDFTGIDFVDLLDRVIGPATLPLNFIIAGIILASQVAFYGTLGK